MLERQSAQNLDSELGNAGLDRAQIRRLGRQRLGQGTRATWELWGEIICQCCLWMLALLVVALLEVWTQSPPGRAIANAHHLYALELQLDLHPEIWVQSVVRRLGLLTVCKVLYFLAQGVVWWLVGLLLYVRDRRIYRKFRNVIFVSWPLAEMLFCLFPCAPPSLSHVGVITGLAVAHPLSTRYAYDAYAAFPSLHMSFAVTTGFAVRAVVRRRRVRELALLWPVVVALVVLGTANHFLLDVFAGTATSAVCYLACAGGWRRLIWRTRSFPGFNPVWRKMPR